MWGGEGNHHPPRTELAPGAPWEERPGRTGGGGVGPLVVCAPDPPFHGEGGQRGGRSREGEEQAALFLHHCSLVAEIRALQWASTSSPQALAPLPYMVQPVCRAPRSAPYKGRNLNTVSTLFSPCLGSLPPPSGQAGARTGKAGRQTRSRSPPPFAQDKLKAIDGRAKQAAAEGAGGRGGLG